MGLGIWSMFYIGMLAFSLPVPVSYDWPTVMLSLRVAILASGVALYVVSRKIMSLWRAVAGSIVMGAGIAAMHYIGMEAMRSTAMCHYDARLVALSIVLAIVISFVAFRLAFLARDEKKASPAKIRKRHRHGACHPGDALYRNGRNQFYGEWHGPGHVARDEHHDFWNGGHHDRHDDDPRACRFDLRFDRRLSAQTLELESAEQRYRQLFERSLAGVIRTTLDGRILDCNLACARIFGYATCEELIASPITDRYFHPEDRNTFIAILRKVKSLTNYEQCLRRRDGSKVWLLGSANLVEGEGGEPTVNEETFVDITEAQKCGRNVSQGVQRQPGTHHHRDSSGRPLH